MAGAWVAVQLDFGVLSFKELLDHASVFVAGTGGAVGGAVMDLGDAKRAGGAEAIEHRREERHQYLDPMTQAQAEMGAEGEADQANAAGGYRSLGGGLMDGGGKSLLPLGAAHGDQLKGFDAWRGVGEAEVVGNEHLEAEDGEAVGVFADHGGPGAVELIGEAITAVGNHHGPFDRGGGGGMELRGERLPADCGLELLGQGWKACVRCVTLLWQRNDDLSSVE